MFTKLSSIGRRYELSSLIEHVGGDRMSEGRFVSYVKNISGYFLLIKFILLLILTKCYSVAFTVTATINTNTTFIRT